MIREKSDWEKFVPYVRNAIIIIPVALVLTHFTVGPLARRANVTNAELALAVAALLVVYAGKQDSRPSVLNPPFESDHETGYWRMCMGEDDVCCATRFEKDRIPEPQQGPGIEWRVGKITCVLPDGFWIWREHCQHIYRIHDQAPTDHLPS